MRFWHVLVWVVLAVAVAGCTQRPVVETVRIGHLTTFSGPSRSRGEAARRGIDLAVAALQAEEKEDGERKLVVFHADHQDKPEVLQAEAVRLLAVNRVAALVVDCDSRLGEALARATQPYHVPIVVTRELVQPAPDSFWVLGAGPAARGQALARFARQQLKLDRLALLTANDAPLADAVADAIGREWSQVAGAPLNRWSFGDEAALAQTAPAVKQWKPQLLALAADWPALQPARRRLAAELSVPLLFAGPDVPPALLGADAGPPVALATAYTSAALTERGKEFASKYADNFHQPLNLDAAQACDAVRLLGEALATARPLGPRKLLDSMGKIECFETLTGPLQFVRRQAKRAVFVEQLSESKSELRYTLSPSE